MAATLWELLGQDEQLREKRRSMWVARFYDLVLTDLELTQYFVGVLMASDPRYRRTVLSDPASPTRIELEHHVGAAVDTTLCRPGASPFPDLVAVHDHLNIAPRHFFRTGAYFCQAGDEVGVPYVVVEPAGCVWLSAGPAICRRWKR